MAEIDILVHGAGPTGCVAALALQRSDRRVAIVERRGFDTAPFRPIALSYASRLILERVGVWSGLDHSPIETIRVSQQRGFGRTTLRAAEVGVPALGYVVDYGALARACVQMVHRSAVESAGATAAARCHVHAEGASEGEEKRYGQDAIVAPVRFEPAATTVAFERFTSEGPLALLPFAGQFAMIWSMAEEKARELAKGDDAQFLRALAAAAGPEPGRPAWVGERSVQPLFLRIRSSPVRPRCVFIGNAAQTLHPVAGQGLNLGLRDAWDLARILRDAQDPGDATTLARYMKARRLDASATIRVTDTLASGFVGSGSARRAARGIALTVLDVLPAPRRFFARRMIFGPSALP